MQSRGFQVKASDTMAVVWDKATLIDLPKGSTVATLICDNTAKEQDEMCIHHIRCYYRPEVLLMKDHPLMSIPLISEFLISENTYN